MPKTGQRNAVVKGPMKGGQIKASNNLEGYPGMAAEFEEDLNKLG